MKSKVLFTMFLCALVIQISAMKNSQPSTPQIRSESIHCNQQIPHERFLPRSPIMRVKRSLSTEELPKIVATNRRITPGYQKPSYKVIVSSHKK